MPPQIRDQAAYRNAVQGLTGRVPAGGQLNNMMCANGTCSMVPGQAAPYANQLQNATNPVQIRTQGFGPGEVVASNAQGQPIPYNNQVQNSMAPAQTAPFTNSAMAPAQIAKEPKKSLGKRIGEGLRDTFIGSPGKNITLPTMTQEQYDTLRQFIPQLMQLQQSNQPSSLLQQLLGQPAQFELPNQNLAQLPDRFQNPMEGFEPIRQRAITEFNTKTVPSLAERFTSMGAGGGRSSAFQGALGSAGAGLQEALAALASQYGLQREQLGANYDLARAGLGTNYALNRSGLASQNDLARAGLGLNQYQGNQTQIVNLLRSLLQSPYENIYQKGQPGLLVAGSQGLGEGLGRAAGAYLGGGFL